MQSFLDNLSASAFTVGMLAVSSSFRWWGWIV